MAVNHIKHIITQNKGTISFVIGNGVNRYASNAHTLSWDELLMKLWDKVSFQTLSCRPEGISVTEFFDILELENSQNHNLQKAFGELLKDWQPTTHHQTIVDFIKSIDAPILTTNFENTLSKTLDCTLFKTTQEGFTDYYPWTSYYGNQQLDKPNKGFGIWHINGMVNYHRSIRLGLTHYMGSVERARQMLHKSGEDSLFRTKEPENWQGNNTWLDIIFNKSIFIIGLGLEENETFLRWLLIERSKYFRKYPERKQKGWYITLKSQSDKNIGKKFFLEKIGFEVLELDSYADIYEGIWK